MRVANLQLALESFQAAGLPLGGSARSAQRGGGLAPLAAGDLVDGDREMTLCLLWRLILHFQLPQARAWAGWGLRLWHESLSVGL